MDRKNNSPTDYDRAKVASPHKRIKNDEPGRQRGRGASGNEGEEVNNQLKTRSGPDGVHLFDRMTGANILFDEISVPMMAWSSAPRQVSVALTNACDLKCPYCYAPKHPAKLKTEHVVEWLTELDLNGCLGVGFGGGEPTLHPDFVSLCRFAATNTGLAVTFTTHAHRLNDKIKTELQGYVHFIRVSMDGVGATYETLRGKSFAEFRRKLENVRALAPFGINFVVNSQTFPDLDIAVQLATESGATEFLLLPERRPHGLSGIDHNTSEVLRTWVHSFHENIRLSVSEIDAAGFPIYDPLPGEKGLRSYAHIDASSVLKRSSFDPTGVLIGPDGFSSALTMLDRITGRIQ